MTQVKKTKKAPKPFNAQQEWLSLSLVEQEKVTNFFNAHNIAHMIYSLSEDQTKRYISSCIRMQAQVEKDEKKNQ